MKITVTFEPETDDDHRTWGELMSLEMHPTEYKFYMPRDTEKTDGKTALLSTSQFTLSAHFDDPAGAPSWQQRPLTPA